MFHVEQAWRKAFVDGAQALHIYLTPQQIDHFQLYLDELLAWNQRINLTSITEPREVAVKHFLDSLAVNQVLQAGSLLDIGSGAGFPGLPIKIFDGRRDVTLLEPNQKKTAFLRHVIGSLQLSSVSVISMRLEELSNDEAYRRRFFNIATRAVALLPALEHVRMLLAQNGRVIWSRTQHLSAPVQHQGFTVIQEAEYLLPGGYGHRVLTVLGMN
jgi:16S rRNA (guanine527-N7)-methyltransferase